jgi:hypothetical protein
MAVIPPSNLDPNAAPWGRHITAMLTAHDDKLSRLGNQSVIQNKQINSSVNSLIATTADIVANAYTSQQAAIDNAATLAAAQAYAAPVVHTHDAADVVSGTLTRPISTTTGNFSTSITSTGARTNVVSTGYVAAYLDVNGVLGYAPSVRALKTNIAAYNVDLTKFLAVPIYSYSYKNDPKSTMHIGPMADDFDAAGLKEFVVYDGNGVMQGLDDKSLLWGLASAYEQSRQSTLSRIANQKYQNVTVTSMTALTLGGSKAYTITWPSAFVDANYHVTASVVNTSGIPLTGVSAAAPISTRTTTGCVVQVASGISLVAGQTLIVEATHI